MTRTFIEVPLFTKRWLDLELTDIELSELEWMIVKNPSIGPIMQGTGGLRKVRFAVDNRGKSHSIRVCYVDFEEFELTYLITVYKKNEQENLTGEQKNTIRKLIAALKEEVRSNYKR